MKYFVYSFMKHDEGIPLGLSKKAE